MPSSQLLEPRRPGPLLDSGADTWKELRKFTTARIALGRAGGSCRTETLLDLRLAHARARDAVLNPFHAKALVEALRAAGYETFDLATAADNRQQYLLRPDLGRRLSELSRRTLIEQRAAWGKRDLALIVSDGLSALAAEMQIVETIKSLLPRLKETGWTSYPILVAPFGRVKLQDEIGEILGARHTLMLLGERPGLASPDSLGAYFTYAPRAGKTDADRNCVSNIRPEGLPPMEAGRKLALLLDESARLGLSGVALKDTVTLSAPQEKKSLEQKAA
jgi:ethanolamine ammonia-lyase small subunit